MTKKLMQRGLIAATLAALIGGSLLTTDALAWRGWHGRQQYENLAPEKQATYDAVMKEYHAKMAPLMEKMMAKRLELNALTGNSSADPKHISALASEIAALQTQIRQERVNLDERLRTEVGIEARGGRGSDCPVMAGPGAGCGPDGKGPDGTGPHGKGHGGKGHGGKGMQDGSKGMQDGGKNGHRQHGPAQSNS